MAYMHKMLKTYNNNNNKIIIIIYLPVSGVKNMFYNYVYS